MGKKFSKKPLGMGLGTVVAASFSIAPMANAEQNPFELTDLSSGYTELAEKGEAADEANCGIEGYCGGSRCGEGKCGGQESSSDEKPKETPEMKCGEGTCGGSK